MYPMNRLNKIEEWFLKRIVRKITIQGSHRQQMLYVFKKIVDEAREEFTEDNVPTLNYFLQDCFYESMGLNFDDEMEKERKLNVRSENDGS